MLLSSGIILIRLFIRLLVGLLLLSAGTRKLIHPRQFRRVIQDYQIIPANLDSVPAFSVVLAFCIPL